MAPPIWQMKCRGSLKPLLDLLAAELLADITTEYLYKILLQNTEA